MIATNRQKMIDELIKKISSWNEYSENIYGYSKHEAENFLKRLQVGIYNQILKNIYWFSNIPSLDTLIQLEINKKKANSFTNITEENYIVYSAIHEIKDHLEYINFWKKAYQTTYHTKINNYEQQPATTTESNEFKLLYSKVLNKNYSWHEAREITIKIKNLNIKENKDFPHNIAEIKEIFNPQPDLLFKVYPSKVKYSTNILNLNNATNNLLNKLNKNTLLEFLKKTRQNNYEEYIRQLIININTQDIEKIKCLLNSLLTPKKIIYLSEEYIPQPYLTILRKHYSYIFQYTTEIEYLKESTEILKNLVKIYTNKKPYEITLIYNMILISYGIIPIPLTKEILNTLDQKTIIEKTIKQAEHLNNKNKGI